MDTADSPGFDAESRELAVARWLIGAGGRAVVDALPRYRREEALALAARLRAEGLDADRTAAALTLSRLRTRATAKFGERAGSMFFTAAGYEQATRLSVGALHAERFLAAGARRIVDFGCGVGADSLAFCLAGLDVTAIEVDPVAALYAAANAPRAAVVCADGLATRLPEADGIWLDPSRRTGDGRRIASPEGWAPPLSRALSIAGGFPVAGIKAAPGIAHDALPAGALVEWVSEAGQLLEAVVWLGVGAGRAAVVDGEAFDSGASAADEPVSFVKPREIGPILLEPDPAVIRSGGIARLCERYGVAPVSGGVAYLSGEATPPHCSAFEVLDVLIPEVKRIKRALAARGIGRVEVKKRGTEVDVAAMAKKLSRRGGDPGVVVFSPVLGRGRAIVARRVDAPNGPPRRA
ncbi:MAG: SAM-dependent methyltransferase [Peptidiphaga sp.]|jgi:putative SAM-dependent methyltransferase|nr:MAG: SAM-dependent methyltransferase [Actinomyces sp.]